ncbi:hypothetical protein COV82_02005 [Candidatus Peregrinibacteria bacterium CG11_big_fil_rev_8_21_14_0_20_46_8]|nr:MAG: hypothetical protein COV82_02005 [Candidatus Peregrinibacteria bacterium CG11_big_fil_rev_8_21_14_0_20_46_8]
MKKILPIGLLAGIFAALTFGVTASAQNVNVSDPDFTVVLSTGSYKIVSDIAFGSLVVNSSSLTITKGDAAYVLVYSFDKHNLTNDGGISVQCFPEGQTANYSQLTITGSDPVVVTPIATDYCADPSTPASSGGGGGGQTVSAGGGGSRSVTDDDEDQDEERPAAEEEEAVFPADVSRSSDIFSAINAVTDVMVASGSYSLPVSKNFGPENALTWTYLSQVALGLKGLSCEDTITGRNCRASAKKADLIPSTLMTRVPTRLDVYRAMLKVIDYDIENTRTTRLTLAFLCRDFTRTELDMRELDFSSDDKITYGAIIKSSRIHRFASRFISKKCYLDKALRKSEFILIAKRTHDILTGAVQPIRRGR